MVLVDTTIWSLALRRRRRDLNRTEQSLLAEWEHLVKSGAAGLAGPIRQEVLSGIRHHEQFERVRRQLSVFPHITILLDDYDRAAEFFNTCRSKGVAGTSVDFLLCAIAHRGNAPLFTTDNDFAYYARILPIRLHTIRAT